MSVWWWTTEATGRSPTASGCVQRHRCEYTTNALQAFRKHKIVDVFDQPGSSDLTANVDFAYLKESLKGVGAYSWRLT